MGCDIHYVVERRVSIPDGGTKWVGLFGKYPHPDNALAPNRDYDVFGRLARGVRSNDPAGHPPRGFPADASDLSRLDIGEPEPFGDYHSHSWLSLTEFCAVYQDMMPQQFTDEFDRRYPWNVVFGSYFGIDLSEPGYPRPDDFRVVFCFDN